MEHESIDAPATSTSSLDVGDELVTAPAATLVDDELLVEEISIDGMCGVY
jgi:mycofactocin precursor